MLKYWLVLFAFCTLIVFESRAQVPVSIKKKSIDSIYYKNNTRWITLTPFFLAKQEFSIDQGTSWMKVGMLGGNVKPYLMSDSIARQNINLYKITRLAGLAQMWVISPLLAYKHFTYDPDNIESTGVSSLDDSIEREQGGGYLTASIIIFFTGTITYHVLSKTFLYRSLHDLNQGILQNTALKNASVKWNVAIDPQTQTPLLALKISF